MEKIGGSLEADIREFRLRLRLTCENGPRIRKRNDINFRDTKARIAARNSKASKLIVTEAVEAGCKSQIRGSLASFSPFKTKFIVGVAVSTRLVRVMFRYLRVSSSNRCASR